MKRLTILVAVLLVAGCARTRNFDLTEFQSGEMLNGIYNSSAKEVIVKMPDGQILKGKYTRVKNATFTFGSMRLQTGTTLSTGSFSSYSNSRSGDAYALLKSETSNLMMEIVVTYQGHHGFGEGRTNDGRIYKVQF